MCLWLCGSVTTITRNCVHRSSPNWVRRYEKILAVLHPRTGVCGGTKIFGSVLLQPVFASLSAFFIKRDNIKLSKKLMLMFTIHVRASFLIVTKVVMMKWSQRASYMIGLFVFLLLHNIICLNNCSTCISVSLVMCKHILCNARWPAHSIVLHWSICTAGPEDFRRLDVVWSWSVMISVFVRYRAYPVT